MAASAPALTDVLAEGIALPADVPEDVFRAGLATFLRRERLDMRALAGELGIGRATLYRRVSFREALLMHAVARLALNPIVPNIQASWVKMGPAGVAACLKAGANDLGGTLMNE